VDIIIGLSFGHFRDDIIGWCSLWTFRRYWCRICHEVWTFLLSLLLGLSLDNPSVSGLDPSLGFISVDIHGWICHLSRGFCR
jgi:hypothetical protein